MRKVALLTLALLLSGCAALPTTVSVSQGPELALPQSQEFAYYSPPGPSVDASPAEIVSGFLNAGSAPQQNYSIAREYLSDQFAQNWQPNAGVLVRSGIPAISVNQQSLVTVAVPVGARVNDLGIYTTTTDELSSLRFQLVQEDGQWRISRAPNLTVVTAPVFNVVFKGYPVYFLDATRQALVPDLRWFPSRVSTGTSLVNALLEGPADWLAPAVTTAIPEGTKLTVDAVRVVDGIALVDFDANALNANSTDRSLLMAQLEATLLQLGGVQRVDVSINGNQQDLIASTLEQIPVSSPTALADKGIFPLITGATEALAGTAKIAANLDVLDYDLSSDGASIAILTPSGITQFRLGSLSSEEQFSDSRLGLLAPQFDKHGYSWLVPSSTQDSVKVARSDGQLFDLEWNSLGVRIAFAVSPEGARVAELISLGDSVRLQIRPVVRDLEGLAKSVGDAEIIAELSSAKSSLAWDNLNALLVIDSSASSTTTIFSYPVLGPRTSLPTTAIVAKKVISGFANASRYMLSENNEVWALNGRNWRKVSENATAIAMQD
ncbi:MAG: hypothetical protein RLZZ579_442 [Actinomycetota bacterium]